MHPAGFEHGVNAWTAVDLAMLQKNLLDVGCELGIFSAMLARRAASPGIIATDGDLKRLANDAACCLRSLNRTSWTPSCLNSRVKVRCSFCMSFPFPCQVHFFKFTFHTFLGQDQGLLHLFLYRYNLDRANLLT